MPGQVADVPARQQLAQCRIDRLSGIHDGRNLDAGLVRDNGAFVGPIVVGEQHHAHARLGRPTPEIGRHRAGQHDARPVIVGEHQRPFVRARRQHDFARPDVP